MALVDDLRCLLAVLDFVALIIKERCNAAEVLAEAADEDLLQDRCLALLRVVKAVRVEVMAEAELAASSFLALLLLLSLGHEEVFLDEPLQLKDQRMHFLHRFKLN